MPIIQTRTDFPRLAPELIEAWSRIETSVASDALNRSQAMDADIKPLSPGMRMCGQARTALSMAADSATSHVAASLVRPGEVLVVTVGGYCGAASWGGNAARFLRAQGGIGVVTDGATRDAAEIRELGFPTFCRGIVPRGPQKGNHGTIDCPVSVGGVAVHPGDLILGDDDGIVVIPLAKAESALGEAQDIVAKEAEWLTHLESGRSLADVLGLKPDKIE